MDACSVELESIYSEPQLWPSVPPFGLVRGDTIRVAYEDRVLDVSAARAGQDHVDYETHAT